MSSLCTIFNIIMAEIFILILWQNTWAKKYREGIVYVQRVFCDNEFKSICIFYLINFILSHFMWRFWLSWTWGLCRVITMDIFAFFYMQILILINTSCWRGHIFSLYFSVFLMKAQMSKGLLIYVLFLL